MFLLICIKPHIEYCTQAWAQGSKHGNLSVTFKIIHGFFIYGRFFFHISPPTTNLLLTQISNLSRLTHLIFLFFYLFIYFILFCFLSCFFVCLLFLVLVLSFLCVCVFVFVLFCFLFFVLFFEVFANKEIYHWKKLFNQIKPSNSVKKLRLN